MGPCGIGPCGIGPCGMGPCGTRRVCVPHLVLRPLAHRLVQGAGLLDLGAELSAERRRRAPSHRLRRLLLLAAAEQHNVRRACQLVAALVAARRRPRPPRRKTAPQLHRAERRAARGIVERRRRRLEVAQLVVIVGVALAVRGAEHVAARHVGVVRAAEGEVVAVAAGVVQDGVLDSRVAEPHGGQRRARVLGEHRAVEREHPSLLRGVDRLSLLPVPGALPLFLVGLLAVLLLSLGLLRVPATATLALVTR